MRPGLQSRCGSSAGAAHSRPMPMSPTRLRDRLDALGWGINQLARRVGGLAESSAQQMARDKRAIPDNLAAWVEVRAAVWGTMPPELQALAQQMGCDRGKFVRYPAGMRPLSDEEAAQMQAVAVVSAALPAPVGWDDRGARPVEARVGAEPGAHV